MAELRVDPLATALGKGSRPESWGLVLVTNWPADEILREPYKTLRDRLQDADGEGVLYVYPFQHLHITIATLSNFKTGALAKDGTSASDRAYTMDVWQRHLSNEFPSSERRQTTLSPLAFQRPKISENAAFFMVGDPTSVVADVRARLQSTVVPRVAAAYPAVALDDHTFNIPSIVHSTFARFQRPSSDSGSLRAQFDSISEQVWPSAGIPVSVSEMALAEEIHPYMHIGQSPLRFPLPATS